MHPSVIGVGYVRRDFNLDASLPATEAGIDLAALQAAQLTQQRCRSTYKIEELQIQFPDI